MYDVVRFSLYLQAQLQAMKMKARERNLRPLRLFFLRPGVTLSKLSPSALQVIREKPLILCIEDDPIHLILRKKVLERDGYNVIGVTRKHEPLNTLRGSPDVRHNSGSHAARNNRHRACQGDEKGDA